MTFTTTPEPRHITLPKLGQITQKTTRFMAVIGTAWTAVLALLICLEAIMRSSFNQPISGLNEFVSLSMAPIMFLQLPAVILTGKLFRVELFTGKISPSEPKHAIYTLAYNAALLALLWLVGDWIYREAVKSWENNDYIGVTGAFEIPTWPFRFVVLFGCTVMGGLTLGMLGRDLRRLMLLKEPRRGAIAEWTKPALFTAIVIAFAVSMYLVPNTPLAIGAIAVFWLFVLLGLGFPIAVVLLGLTAIGIFLIRDNMRVMETTLGLSLTKSMSSFEYAAVPLFIAMGLVLDKARLGEDAFEVAAHLLRRMRGGLGIATVAANAVFASVVGSSIASAAVFSRVAVKPMVENGIPLRVALGTVTGSSVLGMLIPPSILLIVYGLIAEVSVGQLFVAAIIPGLLLALLFAGLAWHLSPPIAKLDEAAQEAVAASTPVMTLQDICTKLWPVTLLIACILGGIYTGWFTATEAAGVGLTLSVIIAKLRGRLPFSTLCKAAYDAGIISAAMLVLMAAASGYSRLLAFAQLPMYLNDALISAELGYYSLMLAFVLVVLALGAILDTVSIILIITPIVLPLVHQLGADPVWFGIVLVVATEIGLLTPPFGVSAYTVREVLSEQGVKLADIFIGVIPFILMMLALVALLILFPSLATALL